MRCLLGSLNLSGSMPNISWTHSYSFSDHMKLIAAFIVKYVFQVAKLLLIMPATNACSERLFSVMRRLKTYLKSTMGHIESHYDTTHV